MMKIVWSSRVIDVNIRVAFGLSIDKKNPRNQYSKPYPIYKYSISTIKSSKSEIFWFFSHSLISESKSKRMNNNKIFRPWFFFFLFASFWSYCFAFARSDIQLYTAQCTVRDREAWRCRTKNSIDDSSESQAHQKI